MPAEKPVVTTVVRAYNRRHRIAKAIQSALRQSLSGQPIIVVDDASTDGTADFVRAEFGDRVTVVEHPENRGPGGAANTGLRAARTPFTAFLDSDDEWYPNYLETMLASFETKPGVTLAYGDVRRSFSALGLDRSSECQPEDSIPAFLAGPAVTMSVAVMRTRSALNAGGFMEDHRIGEDFDFYVRLWLSAPNSFVHVRKPLAVYDNWSGGITKDADVFLQHIFHHVDKFLKEPAFEHLKEQRAAILSRRSFGVAANREVDKWLSSPPSRSCSIVIPGVADEAALIETLGSIAAQRLPPREVIVLYKTPLTATALTKPDWPFLVLSFPQGQNDAKAHTFGSALSMCTASMILCLEAGDTLAPTALDDHRRAFSTSFSTIAFSYGGTTDLPLAPPLPLGAAPVAKTAFLENAPGSLSTMAMSRKSLMKSGGVPNVPDDALWYALACQLSASGRPSVRILRPVLTNAVPRRTPWEDKMTALEAFRLTENGRKTAGVCDELQDRRDHG